MLDNSHAFHTSHALLAAQVTAFQSVPAGSSRPPASVGDDYDSQVAAALAASQNEANTGSSGGWVRKEVPLDVVQSEQASALAGCVCGVNVLKSIGLLSRITSLHCHLLNFNSHHVMGAWSVAVRHPVLLCTGL